MTRHLGTLGVLVLLTAGCAAGVRETPEERTARLQDTCQGAGFVPGSESFRLCLLIQGTNERLAAVERRLVFIEQDTRFSGFGFHNPRYFY